MTTTAKNNSTVVMNAQTVNEEVKMVDVSRLNPEQSALSLIEFYRVEECEPDLFEYLEKVERHILKSMGMSA